jgi:hypothetical protein
MLTMLVGRGGQHIGLRADLGCAQEQRSVSGRARGTVAAGGVVDERDGAVAQAARIASTMRHASSASCARARGGCPLEDRQQELAVRRRLLRRELGVEVHVLEVERVADSRSR